MTRWLWETFGGLRPYDTFGRTGLDLVQITLLLVFVVVFMFATHWAVRKFGSKGLVAEWDHGLRLIKGNANVQQPGERWKLIDVRDYSSGFVHLMRSENDGTWLVQILPEDEQAKSKLFRSLTEAQVRDLFDNT